jgi:hypothetical protein
VANAKDAASAPAVVKVMVEVAANAPVVKVAPEAGASVRDAVNAPAPVRAQEDLVQVDLVPVGARARVEANAPDAVNAVNARDVENARVRKPPRLHPHLQHPSNKLGIANPNRRPRISKQGASFPPQPRRSGRDIKKENREATADGADGVVLVKKSNSSWPTPPRLREKEASQLFLTSPA